MRKIYLMLLLLFVAYGTMAQVTLAGWDMSTLPGGSGNYGPSPYTATTSGNDVTVGGLTRGSGVVITGTGAAEGWGGTSWNNVDPNDNINANKFITFTIKANSGFTMSLSSINIFDYRRSSTGASSALIQYQIDAGTFSPIATVALTNTTASGDHAGPISLTGIADLQNVPNAKTITIRIVPYGATGSTGSFYIFNVGGNNSSDLSITGTTAIESPPIVTPIQLLSFAGKKEGSKNILKWTTASENNNKGFEVQSSTDGRNYSTIGFVPSLARGGFSSDMLQYNFTDLSPVGVKQFYQLNQVDYDGRSKLSNIVIVNGDKPLKFSIANLFPNPVTTPKLDVIINAPKSAKITLVIADISGRILKQQIAHVEDGSNTITIDINALDKGLFFVRLLTDENADATVGKFIKQ